MILVCLPACQKNEPTPEQKTSDAERIQRAQEASAALMKSLGGQLKSALQNGTPASAIHVCQQLAQPLTGSTSKAFGDLEIARTALKVRNSANQPDVLDQKVLTAWQALQNNKQTLPGHQIITAEDGSTIVYKPIITQQICLKCHGEPDAFSPELVQSLNQLYPNDQAINFTVGELRGAFKITFTKN